MHVTCHSWQYFVLCFVRLLFTCAWWDVVFVHIWCLWNIFDLSSQSSRRNYVNVSKFNERQCAMLSAVPPETVSCRTAPMPVEFFQRWPCCLWNWPDEFPDEPQEPDQRWRRSHTRHLPHLVVHLQSGTEHRLTVVINDWQFWLFEMTWYDK